MISAGQQPVGKLRPVGALRPVSVPSQVPQTPSNVVLTQIPGVPGTVNIPGVQAEITAREEAKARAKARFRELEPLSAEASGRFNQAVNVIRLSQEIKDDINAGRNVATAGVLDRDWET